MAKRPEITAENVAWREEWADKLLSEFDLIAGKGIKKYDLVKEHCDKFYRIKESGLVYALKTSKGIEVRNKKSTRTTTVKAPHNPDIIAFIAIKDKVGLKSFISKDQIKEYLKENKIDEKDIFYYPLKREELTSRVEHIIEIK